LCFIDRAFDRPIQFFGKFGLGFLGLSGLIFGWALALKYGWDVSLIQTPLPLLAATVGLSGILFVLLGIIAEVQARIYFEARGKPPYKNTRPNASRWPWYRAGGRKLRVEREVKAIATIAPFPRGRAQAAAALLARLTESLAMSNKAFEKFLARVVRYGVVGFLISIVYSLAVVLIVEQFHMRDATTASALAFILVQPLAYLAHRRVTFFDATRDAFQPLRFAVTTVSTFLVAIGGMYVVTGRLGARTCSASR
jgi:putative flippase GtrA